MSSTDQNTAVVRRLIPEALAGGYADALDELLAPNCVNRAMRGIDREHMTGSPARLGQDWPVAEAS